MGGRPPTVYRERTATKVLESIACGATLDEACKQHGLKPGTVACWAYRDYRGFRRRYFEAFGINALVEASRCNSILDEVADCESMAKVTAARARADMRWRYATRMIPELAEKVDHSGLNNNIHLYIPQNGRLELNLPDKRRELTIDGTAQELESDGTD